MNSDILTCRSADDIPDSWDAVADTPFLKKEILSILEKTNPCGQKYHQAANSVFVTYRLSLNILTYSIARLKVPITILGLPMSISSAGHNGYLKAAALDHMDGLSGLKLILNTEKACPHGGFSSGKTLPASVFINRWQDFAGYLGSLRSAYRYGINKALKKGGVFKRRIVKPSRFDETLYSLYLNVYEKSEFKLEKLPIAFFREFPATFIQFDFNDCPAGFVQLFGPEDTLYFMFGGMDYRFVKGPSLYLNMLIDIIRYGIDHGYQFIDLGQTAEDIKQKLGAVPEEKYMHFGHSNKIVNFLGGLIRPLLAYRRESNSFRVFRRDL